MFGRRKEYFSQLDRLLDHLLESPVPVCLEVLGCCWCHSDLVFTAEVNLCLEYTTFDTGRGLHDKRVFYTKEFTPSRNLVHQGESRAISFLPNTLVFVLYKIAFNYKSVHFLAEEANSLDYHY